MAVCACPEGDWTRHSMEAVEAGGRELMVSVEVRILLVCDAGERVRGVSFMEKQN